MDFECIHCGEIDYLSDHWKECKKHPANKLIKKLRNEIKTLKSDPNLGLATTAQLINELAARARNGGYADYRTVDDLNRKS